MASPERTPVLRRTSMALVCVGLALGMAWTITVRVRASFPQAAVVQTPLAEPGSLRGQQAVDAPASEPLGPFTGSPLVLTYHDVGPDVVGSYNITPERFAQDMASLHAAGWTTIDTTSYLAWLHDGAALPARSMLLTFDDGTAGTWTYVDPILERYDYEAVAFIVTGFIGEGAYYLTWPELHALEDSGRWSIEAHGHLGHSEVPSDAQLTPAPFLLNRRWGVDGLEPMEAFRSRIGGDLRTCVQTLRDRGFAPPRLFAYPFAASQAPTNDPAAAAFSSDAVRWLFEAAVTDNVEVVSAERPDPFNIPRLGITAEVDLPSLFARQLPVFGPEPPTV